MRLVLMTKDARGDKQIDVLDVDDLEMTDEQLRDDAVKTTIGQAVIDHVIAERRARRAAIRRERDFATRGMHGEKP